MIGSIVGRVLPAATAFVASGFNPAAAATTFIQADQARDAAKKARMRAERERNNFMMDFGTSRSSIPTIQRNLAATTPVLGAQDSGGGFFDNIRGGLREVGGFVQDVFSTGIPQLFGAKRPPSVGQQPALTTVTNIGAQESQGSGSIQAGAGALLNPLLQAGRNLLKTPGGQLALGGGAGLATSLFGSDGKQMRVTRKMKSQARMVVNLTGGNLSAAADILNISEDMLVGILLKRFRNDGAVVTKAALRKTKQTIRRLHNMQDVLKSITPTATMRRRAPMKRATTTTLIKN
jgi:hypothetical protein